jgi:hypothetical protein
MPELNPLGNVQYGALGQGPQAALPQIPAAHTPSITDVLVNSLGENVVNYLAKKRTDKALGEYADSVGGILDKVSPGMGEMGRGMIRSMIELGVDPDTAMKSALKTADSIMSTQSQLAVSDRQAANAIRSSDNTFGNQERLARLQHDLGMDRDEARATSALDYLGAQKAAYGSPGTPPPGTPAAAGDPAAQAAYNDVVRFGGTDMSIGEIVDRVLAGQIAAESFNRPSTQGIGMKVREEVQRREAAKAAAAAAPPAETTAPSLLPPPGSTAYPGVTPYSPSPQQKPTEWVDIPTAPRPKIDIPPAPQH